jgi:pyruvate,water dikinase
MEVQELINESFEEEEMYDKKKAEEEKTKEEEVKPVSHESVDKSKNILWLREIRKEDTNIVGGKGANLGEMFSADFPVPDAYVITAQAFKEFFSKIRSQVLSIISSIEFNNTPDLEAKAKKIRDLVVETDMPEYLEEDIKNSYIELSKDKSGSGLFRISEPVFVAVRSSATAEDMADASFAGQQETFLNMKGVEQVLDAVKKCWASLYTARSLFYRYNNHISEEDILIAVVVQKMVNSEKAGVMFTINPLTNNKNQLVIEAVFGLGEGIVLGMIEPDHFVVDKNTEQVLEKRIGMKKLAYTRDSSGKTVKKQLHDAFVEKEVLYPHELKALIREAKKIEEHYDFPQDIEYAFENGDLYITQSRPITTLNKNVSENKEKISGKVILDGLAASHGTASGKVKIIHDLSELYKIQSGDVLVTKMTNPDMVVSMQKAIAIVTDEGGATCHAAIVSRELGIPCIVGTKKATSVLKEGQIITVDGTNGKVYSGDSSSSNLPINSNTSGQQMNNTPNANLHLTHKPGQPLVKVNCDLPEVAQRAAATGADGVGLVRIEFIIAEGGIHPAGYLKENKLEDYSRLLAEKIGKIAEAFKDKPVWIRTSDIRTDEYKTLKGAESEPKEDNPMLGWHGIRRSLDQPEILEAEFKAIKMIHDKGFKNVGVMLPFVIRTDEIKKAKQICKKIGLEPRKDLEFGVMIETPAACMKIDEFCKEGIDFISFGTNDLTQLTLGIDRNNGMLASRFSELHSGVLKLLEYVINECKKYNVKTSICGQAASNPRMVKFLKEKGITSISANIDAVQEIMSIVYA